MEKNYFSAIEFGSLFNNVLVMSYNNDKLDVVAALKVPSKGFLNGEIINDDEFDQIIQRFPPPELPSGQSTFKIDDQTAGNQVSQRLLLNDYEVRLTRTNNNFLRLSFSNNAGMISAKI